MQEGSRVQIIAGQFAGHIGRVVIYNQDNQIVTVRLALGRRRATVVLSADDVQRAIPARVQFADLDNHDWVHPRYALEALGVTDTTLQRWADEGVLVTFRTAGGHRRYSRQQVDDIAAARAANTAGDWRWQRERQQGPRDNERPGPQVGG